MALAELPITERSHARRRAGVPARIECVNGATILWLKGELDLSTLPDESLAMAQAIAEENSLVVDLSEVDFMGAATIGLIASSASFVAARSRSLTVRAPTSFAERLLSICGLGDLVDRSTGPLISSVASGGP